MSTPHKTHRFICEKTFGLATWSTLNNDEESAVIADIMDLANTEMDGSFLKAVNELLKRIGGAENLKSYALTCLASQARQLPAYTCERCHTAHTVTADYIATYGSESLPQWCEACAPYAGAPMEEEYTPRFYTAPEPTFSALNVCNICGSFQPEVGDCVNKASHSV